MADFEKADGTTETTIYEPSPKMVKERQQKEVVDKAKQEGREELEEEQKEMEQRAAEESQDSRY